MMFFNRHFYLLFTQINSIYDVKTNCIKHEPYYTITNLDKIVQCLLPFETFIFHRSGRGDLVPVSDLILTKPCSRIPHFCGNSGTQTQGLRQIMVINCD